MQGLKRAIRCLMVSRLWTTRTRVGVAGLSALLSQSNCTYHLPVRCFFFHMQSPPLSTAKTHDKQKLQSTHPTPLLPKAPNPIKHAFVAGMARSRRLASCVAGPLTCDLVPKLAPFSLSAGSPYAPKLPSPRFSSPEPAPIAAITRSTVRRIGGYPSLASCLTSSAGRQAPLTRNLVPKLAPFSLFAPPPLLLFSTRVGASSGRRNHINDSNAVDDSLAKAGQGDTAVVNLLLCFGGPTLMLDQTRPRLCAPRSNALVSWLS
jgi:hypothetical protein